MRDSIAKPSQKKGPNCVTYDGKKYCKVTSGDPDQDSGDEVCSLIGETCVGYTEPTEAVCKIFHPSSQVVSSYSGDNTGVYCNGPPQTGVCSTEVDTCHVCPACSVGIQCNEAISNLYKEFITQ